MEREGMDSSTWVNTAAKGIRFGPDREAVKRELWEHIEDKTLDLMRIFPGMAYEEARERAMADMGDAEEIGKELARVHKPWLGYLWRLSRVVVTFLLVVALPMAVWSVFYGNFGWAERNGRNWNSSPEAEYTDLQPWDGRVKVDGYTVTMRRALWSNWMGENRVGVVVRTASPWFWDREGVTLYRRMTAVDSVGTAYLSAEDRWEGFGDPDGWTYVDGSLLGHGVFHQDYILWVHDVPEEAEWVRLEYDWMGRAFDMTVYLKEAGI